LTVVITQVRFNAGQSIPKTVQARLQQGLDMVAERHAALDVFVGVDLNLHVGIFLGCGERYGAPEMHRRGRLSQPLIHASAKQGSTTYPTHA
jgi:hypothetical protein